MAKKETMTEAFCRQHSIDPKHPNQSQADEIKNGRLDVTYIKGKRVEILRTNTKQEQAFSAARSQEAHAIMGQDRSSNLRAHSNLQIPSQRPITPREGEVLQKTEEHPHFKGYNHSLEQDRWPLIGGKGGGGSSSIEMGDLTSEDVS